VLAYFKHPQHSSTQKKTLYRLVANKPHTPLEATNATLKKEAPKAANTTKKKNMCRQARLARSRARRRTQALTSTLHPAADEEARIQEVIASIPL
jgi:hypothetical protein